MEFFFSIYSLLYIPLIMSIFIANPKKQKKVIFFWILAFTLFRGLRWEIGTDWGWYYESFKHVTISNFYSFELYSIDGEIKTLEIGWAFLLLVCKTIFGNYTSFLLLTNFLILILYYRISTRFSKNPIISFSLLLCTANFFPVRQDLANALFFYGICFFLEKNRKYFLINNFLAFIIHKTALIALPCITFLKRIKIKYSTYIYAMACSLLISKTLTTFFLPILINLISTINPSLGAIASMYTTKEFNEVLASNVSSPIMPFLLNSFFLYLFYFKLLKNPKVIVKKNSNIENKTIQIQVLIHLFIIGNLINFLFLRTFPELSRMSSYFMFAVSILFSIYYDNLKRNKLTFLVLFALYLIYRYIKHFNIYPELHFPYKTFL